jgi:hypothetical protein
MDDEMGEVHGTYGWEKRKCITLIVGKHEGKRPL